MEDQVHVSLKPEPINLFGWQPDLLGFKITNSVFTFIIVAIIIVVLILSATTQLKPVPGRWQALWELIFESLLNLVENALGRTKLARRLFVLVATLFLFILLANWLSLFPGVGTIGYPEAEVVAAKEGTKLAPGYALVSNETELHAQPSKTSAAKPFEGAVEVKKIEGEWAQIVAVPERAYQNDPKTFDKAASKMKPLEGAEAKEGWVEVGAVTPGKLGALLTPILRPPNADLNMTLAMALITFFTVIVVAISLHGFGGWLKEFFPKPYVMSPLLTPIEIISQLSRIVSLTFRLFGNIFAGEALLAVILSIAAPIYVIFLGLEVFFGFIQAFVFASLTLAYISLSVGHSGGHDEEHGHEEAEDLDATKAHEAAHAA